MTSICVLGLGLMGRPIVRTLLKTGYDARGWNRSKLSPNLIKGIPLCNSLEEAASADVCLFVLKDSIAVDTVLEKIEPYLNSDQVVVDMSTSDPEHSRINAGRLGNKGIGWLDAPVSGGPEGAADGTLAIMAGGKVSDFVRVKPLLDILGGNVVHVGEAGVGHIVKIINQLIVGLTLEAVSEGLILAEKSGVDPLLVQKALSGGAADSRILQLHGTRMIKRSYVPGAKATTQLKDLKLAKALARTSEVKLPHLESLITFYEKLVARNYGDLDHSAIHRLLFDMSTDLKDRKGE